MLVHSSETAFQDRGIDPTIADEMNANFQNGKFVFQYLLNGERSFSKIRTQDKRFYIEPSGANLHLWNIHQAQGLTSKPVLPLVITEGEFDAIAIKQSGFPCYPVSVPNGANGHISEGAIRPRTDSGFSYLWSKEGRLIEEIDQFDRIILATDADEKGTILRDELAIRLGEHRCWFVALPQGCKDANDVLKLRDGEKALREALERARPMRPACLVKPYDLPERPIPKPLSTGWPFLDKHMKVVKPEFIVITGQPNHGKSLWARALAFNMAEEYQRVTGSGKWRTAFLTPEDPPHRILRDMKRFAQRFGHLSEDETRDWCDNHFRFCLPNEDTNITIDFVEEQIAGAKLQHDCDMFVIDPWNEILHEKGRLTENEYIEHSLMRLKRVMRRYDIVLVIVAHPRKIGKGEEATLYDISGSANWRNKCDHGVIIHRDSLDSKVTKVIVAKSKDHETMGMPGEVYADFNPGTCDYTQA